mmetsp:Transcript_79522/g.157561  ORF Transcript_79522/g.157561 Transcript_79522/m.157561 type:complete len:276 (-) Transcript_79522:169-996(-)|eukprot:CAMPEP_0172838712 /NCGR_PEP_ID=MMETSP1075-20121228/28062_1 /TAXON_ID=2916 /ORGANISM="Ceratium fusus, Strain PA161109" /LENGTH=275 /DNA_ID=CAMNT_0013682261 /DNA_START=174 /DNA_END=1001 /DNA_ORIENTATION=-
MAFAPGIELYSLTNGNVCGSQPSHRAPAMLLSHAFGTCFGTDLGGACGWACGPDGTWPQIRGFPFGPGNECRVELSDERPKASKGGSEVECWRWCRSLVMFVLPLEGGEASPGQPRPPFVSIENETRLPVVADRLLGLPRRIMLLPRQAVGGRPGRASHNKCILSLASCETIVASTSLRSKCATCSDRDADKERSETRACQGFLRACKYWLALSLGTCLSSRWSRNGCVRPYSTTSSSAVAPVISNHPSARLSSSGVQAPMALQRGASSAVTSGC